MQHGTEPEFQPNTRISSAEILTQLERILASELFVHSERLGKFLRYSVAATLEGRGHTVKEQVIAQDVFGRGSDFDGAADAIVRVEARRLRDKLREYYASNVDPVIISLPKGGYSVSVERNPATVPTLVRTIENANPVAVLRGSRWRFKSLWLVAALVGMLAGLASWYMLRPPSPMALRVRRLTSLPGNESGASLSPDGNFVVFAWRNGGPADLYIKAVDSESLVPLNQTPEPEFAPAWSPDGREIAFVRGGRGVFVVASVGGPERQVSDRGNRVAWSSDAKSLFVSHDCPAAAESSCVFQIALDGLEKKQITSAADFSVTSLAASPDGQNLAVVGEARHAGIGDVFLVPLGGGKPRRLTNWARFVNGVAWTPDSKYLFYSLLQQGRFSLWQISVKGGQGNGERVSGLLETAVMPSVARAQTGELRVAYQTVIEDVSLRFIELNVTKATEPVGAAVAIADATEGRDCGGRFSPDAKQISFSSFRSGEGLFWIARRDGSALRPLMPVTAQEAWLRGAQEGNIGAWSPNGTHLVLDLAVDGNSDIYITTVNGGKPFRLTSEPSLDVAPSWSPDGQWIYFASDRSGSLQLWKVPAQGGQLVQITSGGGFQPQPSLDGSYVYYVGGLPGTREGNILKRVRADGGEESVVLEGVSPFLWSVTSEGVYFLTLEKGHDFLERYDAGTQRRTRLGMLPFQVARGFCAFMSMSADARFLISNHVDRYESNLGLIDGFR